MGDISLSKAVRSNLLSLQDTASLMAKTQERLATGNKVNSALDNPTNFFTAQGLNSRAGDLNSLMDSMANGIQTLEAADNGLTSITKTLESMQSTLRQARQDKSFQTASYTLTPADVTTGVTSDTLADARVISMTGGAFGTDEAEINLVAGATATAELAAVAATVDMDEAGDGLDFSIAVNGGTAQAVTIRGSAGADTITVDAGTNTFTLAVANGAAVTSAELVEALNGGFAANDMDITAGLDGGNLTFKGSPAAAYADANVNVTAGVIANGGGGTALTLANFGFASGDPVEVITKDAYTAKTVDQLVSEINASTSDFAGKVRASNDNGKLRIENQSTQELTVDGVTAAGGINGTTTGAAEILGNTVRADLADQFNELRDQLDKLSDDASFNGINLLRGDKLTITFNETGTSSIDIQTKDENQVNAANLGVFDIQAIDLDNDATIDSQLAGLKSALNEVRSQSSAFGSNLSIVENRQQFTKSMINTLQTGAANLTLADMNEEAANLLALQTRQSLSSSSLSLASQADQSVLQLIR